MSVSRISRVLTSVAVAAGTLLLEGPITAAAAQGCGPFGGDGSRVKDPVINVCLGFSPTQPVTIRRGADTWITIARHGINLTTTSAIIAPPGGSVFSVTKGTLYLNKSGYPIDLRGYISLTVRIPLSAPLGNGSIIFPSPLGTYVLPVQIIQKGRVTGFAQQGTIPATWGNPVTVTVTGEDIGTLMAVHGLLPPVAGSGTATRQNVTIETSGTAPSTGNWGLVLFDGARGRNLGVYGLASGVSPIVRYQASGTTTVTGGTSGGTYTGGTATGGTTSPPPVPDLTPAWNNVLLRHIVPNRKLNTTFCSGMAAPATGSVTRTVTVPSVRWGVTNAGNGAVTTAFTAQLQSGSSVLQTRTITSLAAGQTMWFTYTRSNSATEVAKLALVPSDAQRSLYRATGSDCVQVSGQATSTDWVDPPYSVVLDAAGAVTAETNKTDNTRTY